MSIKLNWKTIAIAFAGLIGVLVIAIVLFFVFFPKELAAREAERRIEEATERDLVLGGAIDVTFFPALGFSVEQASLSNPEGFDSATPFIAADRIVFAVKVLPLLRGAVEVKELIFDTAQVNLVAEPDGTANWTFPTEETSEDEFTIEDLRLDNVQLINGHITFQGGDGGAPMTLEDVDATLALESLDAPAQLSANLDYRGQRLSIESELGLPRAVMEKGETPLTANIRSAPVNASFNGAFDAETGALAGQVEASGASLRDLLAWMGSPLSEGGGFTRFSVAGQMAREGETTAFTDLALQLDAIEARGALTLLNQESGRLRVTGALSAPSLDLNTYLPAPAQGADAGGVEVDTAWSTAPLDLSGLRALDANLDLTLGSLRFQRMSFNDVALALRIANGAADARLSRISLYEGGGSARLIADGSGATPRVAIELNAQNIQAETLLRDAIGFDRIAGRGRLAASLVGEGNSQAAIMRSLRGNASFSFNDGQWKGVNLAQVARTVQAVLSGQAVGPSAATDFAELSSTLTVSDGVAATDNLRLLNPFARLEGRGLINIGEQTIDMRIAPRAVRSIEGQGGDAGVSGLGVPFRISGPWSRVSFRPALEDVVQDQLRNILSRQQQGSPLATLGETLFGRQPSTPAPTAETPAAETGSETPAPAEAQQQEEERQLSPLEEMLRRAAGRDRDAEKADPPGE
ncbi:MAG: AsmA family protein [Hyphomonadaceae bacterium]